MLFVRGAIAEVKYTGDEAASEINKLLQDVAIAEDQLAPWENLVTRVAELEGGVNRNSSPDSIDILRNVYDAFLSKFPLLFAYWKKYADIEFAIGGTEAAEMVYERGVSCNPVCVDLWTNYCQFKMETCHNAKIVRELFERAADFVHLDFHSVLFWDKFIEFEESHKETANVTKIYIRAFQIPSASSAKYYEQLRSRIFAHPLEELLESDTLEKKKNEVHEENPGLAVLDFERQVRVKIDLHYYELYTKMQGLAEKRWKLEGGIKRAYFHVTELDEAELQNWRDYLEFEEAQEDYHRTAFLYERCLVACALYEEFWLRYARWMLNQASKERSSGQIEENTRLIYMRASCIFTSIDLPTVRLHWARFEEKLGRIDVAEDIHRAILHEIPLNVETIISLAGLKRRHGTSKDAIEYLKKQAAQHDTEVCAQLLAEQARIQWQCNNNYTEARKTFKDQHTRFITTYAFWKAWLMFEISLPAAQGDARKTFELMIESSALPNEQKRELTGHYMDHLLKCGGKDATHEYMIHDKNIHGSCFDRGKVPAKVPEGGKDIESRSGSVNGPPESS